MGDLAQGMQLPTVRDLAWAVGVTRDEFDARLQSMVTILAPFDLRWQTGLAFAWLNLPTDWRASAFARMAEDQHVMVRSADLFALVHGRAPHAVRLALPGGISRSLYEEGLKTLAKLLRNPPQETAV